MPLPGAKYRVKKTAKGNIRLAFIGKKVVEAKKMPPGKKASPLAERMVALKKKGSFSKHRFAAA